MYENYKTRSLEHPVVVLSDFFLDRIVKVDDSVDNFSWQFSKKKDFGGSLRNTRQHDLKGGNATNLAYSLAKFGLPVTLITVADKSSSYMIKQQFSKFPRSCVIVKDGRPGRTVALEFQKRNNIELSFSSPQSPQSLSHGDLDDSVNVMISDLGDNADFGPEKLDSDDVERIKNSEVVFVTNWASNLKGTDLIKFVFDSSKSAFHFIDPADIESRSKEFKEAMSNELDEYDITSLCINENEFDILAKMIGVDKLEDNSKDNKERVREVAKRMSRSLDVHTKTSSYWSDGKNTECSQSFDVDVRVVTGAGDVWDAANTIGYLVDADSKERITFANAAAALYISDPNAEPPAMENVLSMVSNI